MMKTSITEYVPRFLILESSTVFLDLMWLLKESQMGASSAYTVGGLVLVVLGCPRLHVCTLLIPPFVFGACSAGVLHGVCVPVLRDSSGVDAVRDHGVSQQPSEEVERPWLGAVFLVSVVRVAVLLVLPNPAHAHTQALDLSVARATWEVCFDCAHVIFIHHPPDVCGGFEPTCAVGSPGTRRAPCTQPAPHAGLGSPGKELRRCHAVLSLHSVQQHAHRTTTHRTTATHRPPHTHTHSHVHRATATHVVRGRPETRCKLPRTVLTQ